MADNTTNCDKLPLNCHGSRHLIVTRKILANSCNYLPGDIGFPMATVAPEGAGARAEFRRIVYSHTAKARRP